MDGWRHALADKVLEQGEHIPQHCYISHNHPYTSSSGYGRVDGWKHALADKVHEQGAYATATYVGMVV